MKKARTLLKSSQEDNEELDDETLETGAQVEDGDSDQFEADEDMIDSISDAEEFAGTDISKEDIIDAIQAIDALADAVIQKSDAEEVEIDADGLLDEVENMISEPQEEMPAEEAAPEEPEADEDEIPEEMLNSSVKVMISEDGATTVEQETDSIYDSDIDGMDCTVYDTCENLPMEVEDEGNSDNDDLLVVGNSKSNKFKKGFVTIKSCANKRCLANAIAKVKKMVGSSKLTAAHWVIVSALANKMAEAVKAKKEIQSKVLKVIKNNKDMKAKLNRLLKSEAEIDAAGQTAADVKVEDTVGTENKVTEEGDPTNAKSPEEVTSTAGDPVEKPAKEADSNEFVDVPAAPIQELEVQINNSAVRLQMKRLSSSKRTGKTMYIVQGACKACKDKEDEKEDKEEMKVVKNALDNKVVKLGKGVAIAFKNTTQGLLGCACQFEDKGKGDYKVCLKNNKFVISLGQEVAVFSNAEKVIIAQKIASARAEGVKEGRQMASRIYSQRLAVAQKRAQHQIASSKHNEAEVRRIHDEQERERLFQNSQRQMNEEKQVIKQNNTRNQETLDKLYKSMF